MQLAESVRLHKTQLRPQDVEIRPQNKPVQEMPQLHVSLKVDALHFSSLSF